MGPVGLAVQPVDHVLEYLGCDVIAQAAVALELLLVV